MAPTTPHYKITHLVEATGITRRTIRYYVQMELIPPPLGAGRGHYYTNEHLNGLYKIRDLQDRGLTLEQIRNLDRQEAAALCSPQPAPLDIERVTRYTVAPGVELLVNDAADSLTPLELEAIALATKNILRNRLEKG